MQALTQKDLAARWRISPRTLEQWRWRGMGPRYLKVGSRVLYPVEFVEAYEASRIHVCTVGPLPKGTN